jgi:hypothetical protein
MRRAMQVRQGIPDFSLQTTLLILQFAPRVYNSSESVFRMKIPA